MQQEALHRLQAKSEDWGRTLAASESRAEVAISASGRSEQVLASLSVRSLLMSLAQGKDGE